MQLDAEEFAKAFGKKSINIRPIHLEGMEKMFLKFAVYFIENPQASGRLRQWRRIYSYRSSN